MVKRCRHLLGETVLERFQTIICSEICDNPSPVSLFTNVWVLSIIFKINPEPKEDVI